MTPAHTKIGMIGFGAIGHAVRETLRAIHIEIGAILHRNESHAPCDDVPCFQNLEQFIAWEPTLVLECAGHAAVKEAVPRLLRAGIDVVVLSIGVFSDDAVLAEIRSAAEAGRSRMIAATGAAGGLDALRSAKAAGLDGVNYIGRKPPAAWSGSPAAQAFQLSSLTEPVVIFEGDAAAAAQSYPKNANVTAAIALAGVGFAKTRVTLVADPTITVNVHEIRAKGAFGSIRVELHNEALPENPKTSWLAALNAAYLVRREVERFEI